MQGKPKITSSYLNRKTFANNIADNFSKYDRRGYFQRLLLLTRHKVPVNIVKDNIKDCVRKTNEHFTNETLTGVCLYYTSYSIYMIDGLEDVIGVFMENLVAVKNTIFELSYILLLINNIRKVFFPKFLFRTGEPPTVMEKIFEDDDHPSYIEQNVLITQFIAFCREVKNLYEHDEDNNEFMSGDNTRILISTQRLEFVLTTTKSMFDITYYLETFKQVPTLVNYDELVWPISYDYTPKNIFQQNKYDVNFTFPQDDKNK